jgi:hypothetical protein
LAVSTPMDESDVDETINALNEVLQVLKPIVEETTPQLLLS